MKELYARIQDARDDSDVQIRLSYLEIYNETIRDLLSSEPTPPGAGLALREDANNRISVVGITELIPESPESVLQYLQEGNLRRTMSPTEANAVSSRSHAVLQINVTQKPRTASMTEQTTSASLNIIDLAGSERASATRNNGARMKEGANINKSLLALGNCINALCQSGGVVKHVPYRNSKLTRLLKFSLGGNCKTVMVVCISPSSAHYEETHNALKYANQAKNIRTKVSRNMINVDRHVAQYVQAIHELKEENERLRAKLDERGTLESAAEKRKRAEMGREVDEAKKRMRESTDNVTRLVTDKAGFEATTAAAETKLAELRKRLAVVEADLQRFSSKNEVLPSDLEGERDVLRKMVAAEEAALKDETTCAGVRSLLNSLQMQRGIIVAASHNQKFDAEASETVQTLGNAMLAEVEAEKAKVKFTGLLDALRRSTTESTQLVSAATRSTIALREVAGELEYRATATNETASSEGTAEISSTLTLLASQLRSIAGENEKIFEAIKYSCSTNDEAGDQLSLATITSYGASQLSVFRDELLSCSGRLDTIRLVFSDWVQPRHCRIFSPSIHRASPGSLDQHASRELPFHPSTKQHPEHLDITTQLRGSYLFFLCPIAGHYQQSSTKDGCHTQTLPVVEEKKKFRWADEAGEGSIDDKGLAHGPAAEDSATTGDSAGSSSGAEWEDVSDGRTTPAQLVKPATSVAAKPISRSTSLGTASRGLSAFPETKRSVSSTSTLSPLREASGTSADEADISNASPVAPLRPLNPRPPLRATTNTAASAPAARLLNGSSFPVFPATVDTDGAVPVKKAFPRPSAGGPGPIRRRTRTSVAVIGQANPLLTLGAGGGTIPGQSVNSGVGNRVKASRVSSVPGMRSATVTGGSMFA
uniref:Kinesin-like protein n=1 Tax=Kalmanozyma brasiliensis (strain GHG001) TaxID=1365824 RepID=V5GNM0_KALBG